MVNNIIINIIIYYLINIFFELIIFVNGYNISVIIFQNYL